MPAAPQRIRIYQRQALPDMVKLDVSKLGRPWHKLPKMMNDSFDIFDARLSIYFLKKLRVNVALKSMTYAIDKHYKNTQIFATPLGSIAFNIERTLLLQILHDYYGLGKESRNKSLDIDQPVTKTEDRLKNKIGLDLTRLLIDKEIFGEEFDVKSDNTTVISQWSWCVTFTLEGYDEGSFTLLFDNAHVDQMLARLRSPDAENASGRQQPPTRAQIEKMFYGLPLKLNGQIASLNLTVAQLAKIQPGDIIPVNINSNVPVYIGKEQIFDAKIAEDSGKLFLCELNDRTIEKHYE
ncbi:MULTISPECIES: FliM/FliN family flagellar motor switch protein [Enterobacter]|uniref:FliM/FliN family flagellar motor switch protein n=2 Tax=Enterobacter TaxID=547 RepID=A0ABV4JCW0_9ENTR|nr:MULTISPECIES: flagellar motor switch protein FliM [Enterobacter]PNL53471.1 flagellar motor switch protein FliM [Enterobacter hormaechei]HCR0840676.1 FliM/FliN family flagellar motor switch protein [Enterobacter cancerogenus]EKX4010901.1 FliM/FliN family flagellar motor switch protein [Enterobacter cloacae]ELV3045477.1 FliM/FliN family flagellar motor switch protein [Enterobacter chengduensis]KJL96690.1 flagellar motor switch protein FliM [Enterobacter chengduensis]